MPNITFNHLIDISPEKYIEACSLSELYELELLLGNKLTKLEKEMEIQDMDKASMKHKILTQKSKQDGKSIDVS